MLVGSYSAARRAFWGLVLAVAGAVGQAQEGGQAATRGSKPDAAVTKTDDPKLDEFGTPEGSFNVPDGSADKLLKYIDDLAQLRPTKINTQEMFIRFLTRQCGAIAKAADKVLASEVTPEQRKVACRHKLGALQGLVQVGDPESVAKLEALPGEFEKAGFKDLSRDARGALLRIRAGKSREMTEAEILKLADEVEQFLGQGEINRSAVGLAVAVASGAERGENQAAAIQVYRKFGALLAKSGDTNISGLGAMLEGAARRLGLLGNDFKLEGKTVAGKPFRWEDYRGKVVLIDFFATWCGPCRAEIPNIVQNYEAYRDRGFDVVTVSVDRDRKALEDFLEKEKTPWTVLADNAEGADQSKSMATYYGIMGIPQMILVGKDGKVLALNARGEQLGRELAKVLGPLEKNAKR